MPDIDSGPARDLGLMQSADVRQKVGSALPTSLSADPAIDQTLRGSFGSLYVSPGVAQANYQSLSEFAGSAAANDLLANGGARGAERLGPLRPDLLEAQREAVPGALGRALGAFAPEHSGAVSRAVPGAQVLRDDQGVPVVMAAHSPEQQASARSSAQSVETPQWVAGVGMEGRAQYGFVSGSAVVGVVFDEDSFGTFMTGSLGLGVGAGAAGGPTGFVVAGPDEITDVAGLGVQFGGFVAAGAALDIGLTVPVSGDGTLAGAGVTFPLGPTVGGGAGIYSELGYTRVDHLFELNDLQSRGGAVLAELSGTPRAAIDTMMTGLGLRSYGEMASHLVSIQASIARQMAHLPRGR